MTRNFTKLKGDINVAQLNAFLHPVRAQNIEESGFAALAQEIIPAFRTAARHPGSDGEICENLAAHVRQTLMPRQDDRQRFISFLPETWEEMERGKYAAVSNMSQGLINGAILKGIDNIAEAQEAASFFAQLWERLEKHANKAIAKRHTLSTKQLNAMLQFDPTPTIREAFAHLPEKPTPLQQDVLLYFGKQALVAVLTTGDYPETLREVGARAMNWETELIKAFDMMREQPPAIRNKWEEAAVALSNDVLAGISRLVIGQATERAQQAASKSQWLQ